MRYRFIFPERSGHASRSLALIGALREEDPEFELSSTAPDVLVVDVADRDGVDRILEGIPARFRVVLGMYHPMADLVWHPLGEGGKGVTLLGKKFLMLDPALEEIDGLPEAVDWFIFLGAEQSNEMVNRFSPQAGYQGAIFAPVSWVSPKIFRMYLKSSRRAILEWGQTYFEACFFGVPALPVTLRLEHELEAARFGVQSIPLRYFDLLVDDASLVEPWLRVGPRLDLDGARRTAQKIIAWAKEKIV